MNDVVPKSHKFQPGKSGNPAGRPKGSKNAISLVKLQIEGELRAQMKPTMPAVLAEIIRQALPKESIGQDGAVRLDSSGRPILIPGDPDMLKLLFNSWVSKTKSGDDDAPRDKIQIVIGKLDQIPPVNGQTFQQSNQE